MSLTEAVIPVDELTMWSAYGVRLMQVGEDGDWIALGHVEPLRMIAAIRKAAREQLGLDDGDTFGWQPVDVHLTLGVQQSRAVFTEPPRRFADEGGWWVNWGTDAQSHPESVEITRWAP